jgi:hypothetical protein
MSRFLNGGVCTDASCMNCSVHSPLLAMTQSPGGRLPLPRRVLPHTRVAVSEQSRGAVASPSAAVSGFEVSVLDLDQEEDTAAVVVSSAQHPLLQEVERLQREQAAEKVAIARASIARARAREAEEKERQAAVLASRHALAQNENVSGGDSPSSWGAAAAQARLEHERERERRIKKESADAVEAIRRMVEQSSTAREQARRREAEALAKIKAEKLKAIADKEKTAAAAAAAAMMPAPVALAAPTMNSTTTRAAISQVASSQQQPPSGSRAVNATLLASYQSLADAFPKDKFAQLFKVKMPVTKALNQVTSDPQVTLQRAKDIVAVLRQARELSEDVFKIVVLHFATQVCGMILSKMGNKVSNVFPYAALTAFVCHHFEDCWVVLTAALQSRCSYLIPFFEPRRAGESERAFKERIGCGNESNYIREQNGYVTFYCAVCCAQVAPTGDWRAVMPRMPELWRLLSAILNRKPGFMAPDIVTAVLEVAGAELLLMYGKQAQKVLQLAHTVYLPLCKTSSVDGIVEQSLLLRLGTLLEQCARSQYSRVPEVDAKIFPDFMSTKRAFQMKPL